MDELDNSKLEANKLSPDELEEITGGCGGVIKGVPYKRVTPNHPCDITSQFYLKKQPANPNSLVGTWFSQANMYECGKCVYLAFDGTWGVCKKQPNKN